MFDQVVNHVGYGDFSEYYPFNATTDFHNCDGGLMQHAPMLPGPAGPKPRQFCYQN